MNVISTDNSVVAIFKSHAEASSFVNKPQHFGFAIYESRVE